MTTPTADRNQSGFLIIVDDAGSLYLTKQLPKNGLLAHSLSLNRCRIVGMFNQQT
jgi:hypothetical protein